MDISISEGSWKDIFFESKVIHGFLTEQGSATLTPCCPRVKCNANSCILGGQIFCRAAIHPLQALSVWQVLDRRDMTQPHSHKPKSLHVLNPHSQMRTWEGWLWAGGPAHLGSLLNHSFALSLHGGLIFAIIEFLLQHLLAS